jgi:hypothetical protein
MSSPLFDGLGPVGADDARGRAARRGSDAKSTVRVALPVPVDRLFDYALDARALSGESLERGPGRTHAAPLDREGTLVGRRA